MAQHRNQTQSTARPAVVGVADHNGWGVLVTAAEVNGEPTVIDRRRVELVEKGVPSQPYHHETLAMKDEEAERLLREVRRSVAARTALAFDRLSADLWPQYRVASITIRQPPLAELPATVGEVHRSYYTQCRADGMLYHSAICQDARRRGWEVGMHPRGEEVALAAKALQMRTDNVERLLDALKQTVKSPWTAEHRKAFAAAIAGLKNLSRPRGTPGSGHRSSRAS